VLGGGVFVRLLLLLLLRLLLFALFVLARQHLTHFLYLYL
jgi:hypothetical protein